MDSEGQPRSWHVWSVSSGSQWSPLLTWSGPLPCPRSLGEGPAHWKHLLKCSQLICISVFVPVPYCPDDCGFVVEPEVRQVDSSSPFFFFKIALAIRGFLYFHTNCEIICSSSVKGTVGSLIGIALNHYVFNLHSVND